MELTRKQFDVLIALLGESLSQREISERTHYSLGTINSTIKELNDLDLLSNGKANDNALLVLENYRAKRAIFIAAGFGSRLVPITLNTPKPLVRVNGKRIIDGLIDACLEAGISDIYIVRGYLAEQFDQLLYKYPMIKFIDNPLFNEANNISSSMHVRHLLSNAYVFEADLLIHNPNIITKYHYQSDFLGFPVSRTDDWCFETKDNIITKEKVGGTDCYQMVGISYWNNIDGQKLASDIKETFEMPGGKEKYWEQVALDVFKDHYKVEVRECKQEDIIEIDTFKELKAIDKTYDI